MNKLKIFGTLLLLVSLSSIPSLLSAVDGEKPMLVFKDKTHHIEIHERMFDGVQHYLELENKQKQYVIICELNIHRNIFIMKNKSPGRGFLSSYYDVADTTNGIAKSLNGEVLGNLAEYEHNYIKPDKLEMQLLQTAAARADPQYNLQLRKIKFFMTDTQIKGKE